MTFMPVGFQELVAVIGFIANTVASVMAVNDRYKPKVPYEAIFLTVFIWLAFISLCLVCNVGIYVFKWFP